MLEPIPFAGMVDIDMNNVPVALTQGDILGILQDANSVPLGQPIFNSSEEYNKLKAIIESAIRYTYPADLTDEEIIEVWGNIEETYSEEYDARVFARAILRKAQE
jgi:hypothetical protein